MCRVNNTTRAQNVSRVLMIRSLPQGLTGRDLENWVSQHHVQSAGAPKALSCVKTLVTDKQVGFVQMGSREEAQGLMEIYQNSPHGACIQKNGVVHTVSMVYSDRPEITAGPKAKNQIANTDQGCRVLLCVLSGLQVAIQLSEIFWIFSQFGQVGKISSFIRNQKNQVLVQFATREQASLAMAYLNGRDVDFTNSQGVLAKCQFSIVPSKLPYLTFKCQDTANRDYCEQNALLGGDLSKFAELQGHAAIEPWMLILPQLALAQRVHTIRTNRPNVKFFRAVKSFVWGNDISATRQGVLVPPQPHPSQYGTIPLPDKVDRGIPEGQIGDCVHLSNIGDTNAWQLWRLMGVYGEVVAAKLLYKNPGSAVVQFRNKNYAQNAIRNLTGLPALNGNGTWELNEGKNPNAMHWSGARTELDNRMVNIMGTHAPMLHPSEGPIAPTRNVLLWSNTPNGFNDQREMLESVGYLFQELGQNAELLPQAWCDAEGRTSYLVVLPTVQAAVAAVATVNGSDAGVFQALSGRVAPHVKLGLTFISDDRAAEMYSADDDQLARCMTLASQTDDEDDDGFGPRSKTLPA